MFWIICTYGNAYANSHTIKIALVGPFTGTYAGYGTQLLSGATQAINDINSSGGLKGIKLEIVPIDDQCDPDLAITQATKIVKEQNYQAVIGHVCSACTLATANIYAKANILVITPTSTHTQITQRGIDTLFRMTGKDDQQATMAANFLVSKLRSKRVAILHDNDIYSKGLADQVSENLLRQDTTPILYQEIPRGSHDFAPLVKKLKALKADAIYFPGLYPEVSALAKALHTLQLQIPLLSSDGLALQKFVHTVGGPQMAHSTLMTFAIEPKALLSSQKVIHDMQKQHLETTGYALYAYATVQAIAKSIEGTNTTEGKVLAHWLHQHEVDTVLGKKSWDTNGDIVDSSFKVYAWKGESVLEIVAL